MDDRVVVSGEQWLVARKEPLAKEKELSRQRDALNAERRRLPMVEIDKHYVFEGRHGRFGLPDLFDGRGQLLLYHFMFDPACDEACPTCSFPPGHIGDLTARGRQEECVQPPGRSDSTALGWLRHHDRYGT